MEACSCLTHKNIHSFLFTHENFWQFDTPRVRPFFGRPTDLGRRLRFFEHTHTHTHTQPRTCFYVSINSTRVFDRNHSLRVVLFGLNRPRNRMGSFQTATTFMCPSTCFRCCVCFTAPKSGILSLLHLLLFSGLVFQTIQRCPTFLHIGIFRRCCGKSWPSGFRKTYARLYCQKKRAWLRPFASDWITTRLVSKQTSYAEWITGR